MAGPRQHHPPAPRLQPQIQTAGEQLGAQVDQQPVGAAHHLLGRLADRRVGADRRAHLPHQPGRRHIVALHVPDHRRRRTPGRDEVVEVAADVHAAGGRQIAGRRLDAGQRGQRVRQQGLLQPVGQAVLRVVDQGPVQSLGHQSGQAGQDRPFLRGERVRSLVGQDAGAHRPPGGDQRQERPRREAVVGAPPGRVQALELLPGLEERGHPRPQDLRAGEPLGERGAVEALGDRRVGIAPMPQHVQPAGPRAEDDQALAAHGRGDLVRDQLHHVPHAHRLGQRAGQAHHPGDGHQPSRRHGVLGQGTARPRP